MNGEWVDGGDLQVGDLIQKVDGTHGVVQFNTIEYRTQTMYNLTVAEAHTFYVGDGDWLVHNCGRTTVLGHYPEYVDLAEQIGARTFQLPDFVWRKWEKTDPAKIWEANKKFLDRTILAGDKIVLATPYNKVRVGSYLEKEVNYLLGKGYTIAKDGLSLIAPK